MSAFGKLPGLMMQVSCCGKTMLRSTAKAHLRTRMVVNGVTVCQADPAHPQHDQWLSRQRKKKHPRTF